MSPHETSNPFKNVIGKRFGRLTVLRPVNPATLKWLYCLCDCGTEATVRVDRLRAGSTQSCGCYRSDTLRLRATHGDTQSAEYNVWRKMISRCTNPKVKHYNRYGGRGISVCARWMSYAAFLADMGRRPSALHSIERNDNDGNYEPSNCRWATKREQANNRRGNKVITFRGVTMTAAAWTVKLGLSRTAIYDRLRRNWSVERALTTTNLKAA